MLRISTFIILFITIISCTEKKLPYLGEKEVINGKEIPKQIPAFAFINQDSVIVTEQDFVGKIYVADFFFTSCPTICPVMKTQMLRIHEKYKANDQVGILSHSIDPTHDTPAVLKSYKQRLKIDANQWQFVTGERKKIFEIGEKHYMVTAQEDKNEPGGLLHSGAFMLIDKNRHIRGMYDGTKAEAVDQLMDDMAVLLKEK